MNAIPPVEARELERLHYWQGQTLRSRDFRDQLAVADQLRWWHARAMHRAFGIALGFAVQHSGSQVRIRPGLAYDWFGRELLLCREQVISLPRLEGKVILVACVSIGRGESCATVCADRPSTVRFFWKPDQQVEFTDGVPLALWTGRELLHHRPTARSITRPKMCSGATIAGATAWQAWDIALGARRSLHGARVAIDLSAAGFASTPCCFAWLQLPSSKDAKKSIDSYIYWQGITDATVSGFTFRVLIGNLEQDQDDESAPPADYLQQQKFYVSWLALQSPGPKSKNGEALESFDG